MAARRSPVEAGHVLALTRALGAADAGLVTEGAGGLHAEQHFGYHRPVRVGDVLTGASRPGCRPWA
jgi:acyl-CoA thioesterase FadM